MSERFAIFPPGPDKKGPAQEPADGPQMRKGRVKWFDATKGYGFIEDEQGQEVFVHFTAIQEERFRTLEPGSPVIFASVKGEKGPKAIRVIKLSPGGAIGSQADTAQQKGDAS